MPSWYVVQWNTPGRISFTAPPYVPAMSEAGYARPGSARGLSVPLPFADDVLEHPGHSALDGEVPVPFILDVAYKPAGFPLLQHRGVLPRERLAVAGVRVLELDRARGPGALLLAREDLE